MKKLVISLALALAVYAAASPVRAQLNACAVPGGPLLPDLIVDANAMTRMTLALETYAANSCTVLEGCVPGAGTHLVLRFTSRTPNVGATAMHIGDPRACSGLFHFDTCHGHAHFKEYADYRLWTRAGFDEWRAARDLGQPTNSGANATLLANAVAAGKLLVGRKQGFCLIDISREPSVGGGRKPYYRSCSGWQGISVGWADEYSYKLGCQFVVMTGLTSGTYVLEDHVNPEHQLPESSYTNNSSAVQFTYDAAGRIGNIAVLP